MFVDIAIEEGHARDQDGHPSRRSSSPRRTARASSPRTGRRSRSRRSTSRPPPVVRTLDVGKQPRGMAMSKSGKLYVANFYGDSIDVFEGKDLDKNHRIPVVQVPAPPRALARRQDALHLVPQRLAAARDGRRHRDRQSQGADRQRAEEHRRLAGRPIRVLCRLRREPQRLGRRHPRLDRAHLPDPGHGPRLAESRSAPTASTRS